MSTTTTDFVLTEDQEFKIARKAFGRWGFDIQRIGGKYSLSYHGKHLIRGSWQEIDEYLEDTESMEREPECDCPRCNPKPKKKRSAVR